MSKISSVATFFYEYFLPGALVYIINLIQYGLGCCGFLVTILPEKIFGRSVSSYVFNHDLLLVSMNDRSFEKSIVYHWAHEKIYHYISSVPIPMVMNHF